MYILPAIDLRDGKCVRLIQGEYHRQITYQDDPAKQAKSFVDAGAIWIHLVDLDGAKVGRPVNIESVKAITAVKGAKYELGGGIRDEDDIKMVIDLGIDRVIIGTSAVNEFDWFAEMAEKFPGKIALGLDARGSKVASHGWTKSSARLIHDFAQEASKLPISAIIYTDISKDGMLSGPNFERTKQLADDVKVPIIASGGVSTIEDIQKLAQMNLEGAIVGRALYEGSLKLEDAIAATK
jgi:phosphoribosylformimino-5-aminoimidazole carboxamide ribotide isomerase